MAIFHEAVGHNFTNHFFKLVLTVNWLHQNVLEMRFYKLNDEVYFNDNDKHPGKTLEEIVKIDPQYIENCVLKVDNFCLTESVINGLRTANPNFELSPKAMAWLYKKYDFWVFENVENEVEKFPIDWYERSYYTRKELRWIDEERSKTAAYYQYAFKVFMKVGKQAVKPINSFEWPRRSRHIYKKKDEEPQNESPHYDENLDLDQQSMEFWNSI